MRVIKVKSLVIGTTYDEIIKKAEKNLSDFFEVPVESLSSKLNYEILIWQSNDDSINPPVFSAEILAQVKKDL